MTANDRWFHDVVGRVLNWMAVIAAVGTAIVWIWRGWRWGAGFAVGAAVSFLNFHWLRRLTEALGAAQLRRTRAVFLASRYVVLALLAYVILRYSSINLPAALMGLFVSTAAVIIEILYELAYARK